MGVAFWQLNFCRFEKFVNMIEIPPAKHSWNVVPSDDTQIHNYYLEPSVCIIDFSMLTNSRV